MSEIICDCGHAATPNGLAAGYARDAKTDATMCYSCAADVDLEYARTMAITDPPLFAYVRALNKALRPGDARTVAITTWPGLVIGRGYASETTRMLGGRVQFITAQIGGVGGRIFHGRHYLDAGDYVRLRPYKNQEEGYGLFR